MRRFALRTRLALLAAVSACALAAAGGAAAAGPIFAVVSDDAASVTLASPTAAAAPAISLSAFQEIMASDPLAAAALRQETLGAQAVSLALQHIGVPYVWGGETPSGFDCSGLTMYVYGQLGVRLSHWTGFQWNEGAQVAWNQLQAGDLVFFDLRDGAPQHMGMYIGRGLMVHAPRRGEIVRVVSLSDSYALRFARGVRPYSSPSELTS